MSVSAYASSPFDHGRADVVLRSSDNVDFRVFRLFLSLSSPFFETLFDLPQPSEEKHGDAETKDGLPVIPVSEDSKTLEAVLRFCYPRTLIEKTISIKHFKDGVKMLEAAKKYSLDGAESAIRKTLFSTNNLEADPLRCFVVARQARMRDETILSAKYCLQTGLIPGWFEEIEMITATDLLDLLAYHEKCGKAAQQLQSSYSWIERHYKNRSAIPWIFGKASGRPCPCPRSDKIKLFGRKHLVWWEEFMEATFQTLKEKPCARTVRESVEKTITDVRSRDCRSCAPNIATVMHQFADLFAKKVEEVVAEVKFVSTSSPT